VDHRLIPQAFPVPYGSAVWTIGYSALGAYPGAARWLLRWEEGNDVDVALDLTFKRTTDANASWKAHGQARPAQPHPRTADVCEGTSAGWCTGTPSRMRRLRSLA